MDGYALAVGLAQVYVIIYSAGGVKVPHYVFKPGWRLGREGLSKKEHRIFYGAHCAYPLGVGVFQQVFYLSSRYCHCAEHIFKSVEFVEVALAEHSFVQHLLYEERRCKGDLCAGGFKLGLVQKVHKLAGPVEYLFKVQLFGEGGYWPVGVRFSLGAQPAEALQKLFVGLQSL